METKQLTPFAFKMFSFSSDDKLEDVIEASFAANNDNSSSFLEEDLGLKEDSSLIGKIRNDRGNNILKVDILSTFHQINPKFKYTETVNLTKRSLTSPDLGVSNNNHDNEEFNLIVYPQDEINGYIILDILGQGISGQVFKVFKKSDEKLYALKIIKNRKVYKNQALVELKLVYELNKKFNQKDCYHIIRIMDYFLYQNHLCIVFELLNENLYELLQHNNLQGISLNSIRFITKQILEAIEKVHSANIIHCDLKPENILLLINKENKNTKREISIKVTDFGSACEKNQTIFTYIQSRYYRAPEVILGLPYSIEIDIWSIGLIAAELYLGRPLIPGICEYDQLYKIVTFLGEIPEYLLIRKKTEKIKKYFNYRKDLRKYILKTPDEYYKTEPIPSDICQSDYNIPFDMKCLNDLAKIKRDSKIKKYNDNSSLNSSNQFTEEIHIFVHFLKKLLALDPSQRFTAKQCLHHPFITKEKVDSISNWEESFSQLCISNNNIFPNTRKNNSFHSMVYNVPHKESMSNSLDFYGNKNLQGFNPNANNCIQPNLNNINMYNMMRFPFALVNQSNLRERNSFNKNAKMNQTFMVSSFEKINPNSSISNSQATSNRNSLNPPGNIFPNFYQNTPRNNINNSFTYDSPGANMQTNVFSKNQNLFLNKNKNILQQEFKKNEEKGKIMKSPHSPMNNQLWNSNFINVNSPGINYQIGINNSGNFSNNNKSFDVTDGFLNSVRNKTNGYEIEEEQNNIGEEG